MANRLRHETSPYLLQHADNPVEWQPWDEQALTAAREQDRPILLSIGYSACHWCHVMERESFEDAAIAALMNERFVCIKVDREERPDLDRVYQLAHQMLTRRPGGWPLTVVLTPQGHAPFFAGTYFPPEPRMGMPGFGDVLRQVAEHYQRNRSRMESHDDAMVEALAQINPRLESDAALPPSTLFAAREALAQQYDARYGGFGNAPKFPQPTRIELLLWRWRRSRDTKRPDPAALGMAVTTLRRMADGGLFDQLAGGFYRYSVDQRWSVPHFEKMLYDNAQLLPLYADTFLAGGDERLREAALMTGEWVMAEMQGGKGGPGGYYSTLDADSEGKEGKFYTWTTAELESLLNDQEWSLVRRRFGLTGRPNFEGKWHLNVADGGTGKGGSAGEAELLESARFKLLDARAGRVRPGCDDKMLTAWNGLMIKGMARAGVVLGRPDFIDSARRALDFLRGAVWREGRLLAATRNGSSHLPGYLDDYAMLADGVFELCQAAWRDGDLAFAIELTEAMLAHFEDPEEGGFFFTADDHEALLLRPKPGPDDAIPSGNGVAASLLVRLGHLLGEPRYLETAERTIALFGSELRSQPAAYGSLTLALEALCEPAPVIVLRGPASSLPRWQSRLAEHYTPGQVVLAIPEDAQNLPRLLAERRPGKEVVAYLCQGARCLPPITKVEQLIDGLSAVTA